MHHLITGFLLEQKFVLQCKKLRLIEKTADRDQKSIQSEQHELV